MSTVCLVLSSLPCCCTFCHAGEERGSVPWCLRTSYSEEMVKIDPPQTPPPKKKSFIPPPIYRTPQKRLLYSTVYTYLTHILPCSSHRYFMYITVVIVYYPILLKLTDLPLSPILLPTPPYSSLLRSHTYPLTYSLDTCTKPPYLSHHLSLLNFPKSFP